MARILVVEDDRDLRNGVVYALENEGYEVETAGSLWELEAIPVSSVDAFGYYLARWQQQGLSGKVEEGFWCAMPFFDSP